VKKLLNDVSHALDLRFEHEKINKNYLNEQ
jgi:hypothetical protein